MSPKRLLRAAGNLLRNQDQLILLRHGESLWTRENRFTSWVDVPLTARGVESSHKAGALLKAEKLADFDVIYTSSLSRSIKTAWAVQEELGMMHVPLHKCFELCERMYGGLSGMSKKEAAKIFGAERLKIWRRSLDAHPPPLDTSHPLYHKIVHDSRFAHLTDMPLTESLSDVITRLLPLWEGPIAGDLRKGRRVLVCAHSNSLRALITLIEGLTKEQVLELNVPNSFPIVFDLDAQLRPRGPRRVLGDMASFEAATRAVAEEASVGQTGKQPPSEQGNPAYWQPPRQQKQWVLRPWASARC